MEYSLDDLPPGCRLLIVTKGQGEQSIQSAIEQYGSVLVGESRWQEVRSKYFNYSDAEDNSYPLMRKSWAEPLELHFIGRLQSNKLKYIVPHFDCIQSVSSLSLINAINSWIERKYAEGESTEIVKQNIMLQVNVSEDEQKGGFLVEELPEAVAIAGSLPYVELTGLMTITAQQDITQTEIDFTKMKQLQEQFGLTELSMGMSTDWPLAVQSGATIVRVGTAVFSDINQDTSK